MKRLHGTVSGLLTAGFIDFLSFGHPAFAEQVLRQQILEALTATGWEGWAGCPVGRGADGSRAHGAASGASGEIDVISRDSLMSILSAICSNRLATARIVSAAGITVFVEAIDPSL